MSARAEPDENYRLMVEKIIERRKQVGMTQVQLAEAIQTEQSQISKYERHERIIGLKDFARICRSLKIDPRKLLDLLE